MSDCRLTPDEQFSSYQYSMVRTSYIRHAWLDDHDVCYICVYVLE